MANLRSLQQSMLTAIITGNTTEHVTGWLDVYARSYKLRTLHRALATLEKAKKSHHIGNSIKTKLPRKAEL